jgi:hypothetical protein
MSGKFTGLCKDCVLFGRLECINRHIRLNRRDGIGSCYFENEVYIWEEEEI